MKQLYKNSNKSLLLVGACWMLIWGSEENTQAQVLAYEGFNYFNTTTVALHNANTNAPTTNHKNSLGWATDWSVTGSNTAANGMNINPNYSPSITIGSKSLITSGKFATGGSNLVAARKLQTSTGGPFRIITINANGVETAEVKNYLKENHPSASGHIGRDKETIWMSILLRKEDAASDNMQFVYLHRNSSLNFVPAPASPDKYIGVGYFGSYSNVTTNGLTKRFWTLLVNGTVFRTSVEVTSQKFTLLVVSITFDNVAGNKVNLYVDPLSIGGSAPISSSLEASTAATTDNSFHTLGYYAGGTAVSGALDEIRFGTSYKDVTLASDKIEITAGLVTTAYGDNVFPAGDFGSATALNSIEATKTGWTLPTPVFFRTDEPTGDKFGPNYKYVTDQSLKPDDGDFTIVTGSRNIWGGKSKNGIDNWISIGDNSNTSNGFMMIVNASYNPDLFYQDQVNNLCGETEYEFSIDVINLIPAGLVSIFNTTGDKADFYPTCDPILEPGCQQLSTAAVTYNKFPEGGNVVKFTVSPEIEFLVNGEVVYKAPSPVINDSKWHKIGFTFKTKQNVNSLLLGIRNTGPGGIGNDIGLDNISIRPVRSAASISYIECSSTIDVIADPGLAVQWQVSKDNVVWKNLSGKTSKTYTINQTDLKEGNIFRAQIATSAANFVSQQCVVSTQPVSFNCFSSLPVRLLSFTANENHEGIRLSWQTASEKDNDYFAIEKSANGIDFSTIATIDGKGTTSAITSYQNVDRNPFSGHNYYRLKQVDFNGKSEYSNIAVVIIGGNLAYKLSLYPNPVNDQVRLIFSDFPESTPSVSIRFVSMLGKEVKMVEASVNQSHTQVSIPVSDLTQGVYMVEVYTRTTKTMRKLAINR